MVRNGGPALYMPFNSGALLIQRPGFLLKTVLVVELLIPFLSLQAIFAEPTAVPSWVHSPNPPFEHLAPLCTRRHTTQAGVHRAEAQTHGP